MTIRATDESGKGVAKKSVKMVLQPGEGYRLSDTTVAKAKVNYTP